MDGRCQESFEECTNEGLVARYRKLRNMSARVIAVALIGAVVGALGVALPAQAEPAPSAEQIDKQAPTPKGPVFNDWSTSVDIPSDYGIRYYIEVDGDIDHKGGVEFFKTRSI